LKFTGNERVAMNQQIKHTKCNIVKEITLLEGTERLNICFSKRKLKGSFESRIDVRSEPYIYI